MRIMTKRVRVLLFGCLVAATLTAGLFGMKARGQNNRNGKVSLTAVQVISSVTTAVTAKPGNVLELEAESEKGKLLCEVEILAQDGKTYEVVVDVNSNTVVEVEEEDDDDDDDDDNDDDNGR